MAKPTQIIKSQTLKLCSKTPCQDGGPSLFYTAAFCKSNRGGHLCITLHVCSCDPTVTSHGSWEPHGPHKSCVCMCMCMCRCRDSGCVCVCVGVCVCVCTHPCMWPNLVPKFVARLGEVDMWPDWGRSTSKPYLNASQTLGSKVVVIHCLCRKAHWLGFPSTLCSLTAKSFLLPLG